jgi:hypothetical protein
MRERLTPRRERKGREGGGMGGEVATNRGLQECLGPWVVGEWEWRVEEWQGGDRRWAAEVGVEVMWAVVVRGEEKLRERRGWWEYM